MNKITIIVPCYNEEEVVEIFYKRLKSVISKISDCEFLCLFINDGSHDKTLEKLRNLHSANENIEYISLSRNFGKEAAMMTGLDFADGDAVIIMDADLQHPPELIPEMLSWWRKGFEDVCTKRFDRNDESLFKKNMTNFFYKSLQKFSDYRIQRDVGDFRLLDRRCVNALRLLRERQRFTKGLFSWIGFRKKEIRFKVPKRVAGITTWNYFSLFTLAVRGLTSFTTMPLHFTAFIGLFVSAIAIIYMFWVLGNAILFGDPVAGYPTLMVMMLFLGGVQLLSLGIIGEYLGQIFNESKQRPIYLIEEMNGRRVRYIENFRLEKSLSDEI